jgi:hypothetical protein
MPLIHSGSKKAIGENIKREISAGKPQRQSIAIALNTAREAGAHIPKKHGEKKMAHAKKAHTKEMHKHKEHHHEEHHHKGKHHLTEKDEAKGGHHSHEHKHHKTAVKAKVASAKHHHKGT